MAASISDGLASAAGALDAKREKAKEKAEKPEPPPVIYGNLPTSGQLEINHKIFDHPDFIPNPEIFKKSASVRSMFMPAFYKNWNGHGLAGFGIAGATLVGAYATGCRIHYGAIGLSLGLGSAAAIASVLYDVYDLMQNLVVRTFYKTKRVQDQHHVNERVGYDTEVRPERMHHSDKIKYEDPTTIEMTISDVILDRRDDSIYINLPRKRGLNVSLELFSQFAGYTMMNSPTKEFYLGLQRDIKRMCSIRFERYGMAMGTIFNDTALFITAHKLSEMTKRDMHEQPLN